MRRDTAWVDSTLQRLVPLLQRVLPPLCSHPQHSVREALAEGEKTLVWLHNQIGSICGCSEMLISWSKAFTLMLCLALRCTAFTIPVSSLTKSNCSHLGHAGVCEVMSHCAVTLAPASEMLLGIVLALAADEWPQVAEPCRAFLGRGWAGSTDADGPSQRHLLAGLISKLIPGLADAAKGNQDALILHARRLSTALQVPTASLTGPSSSLAKDLSIAEIPCSVEPATHGAPVSHSDFGGFCGGSDGDALSPYQGFRYERGVSPRIAWELNWAPLQLFPIRSQDTCSRHSEYIAAEANYSPTC